MEKLNKIILNTLNGQIILSMFNELKEKTGNDLLAKVGGPEVIADSLRTVPLGGDPGKAEVIAGLLAEYLSFRQPGFSRSQASTYVYQNINEAHEEAIRTHGYADRFNEVLERLKKRSLL